jgi:hypothetical protein
MNSTIRIENIEFLSAQILSNWQEIDRKDSKIDETNTEVMGFSSVMTGYKYFRHN